PFSIQYCVTPYCDPSTSCSKVICSSCGTPASFAAGTPASGPETPGSNSPSSDATGSSKTPCTSAEPPKKPEQKILLEKKGPPRQFRWLEKKPSQPGNGANPPKKAKCPLRKKKKKRSPNGKSLKWCGPNAFCGLNGKCMKAT